MARHLARQQTLPVLDALVACGGRQAAGCAESCFGETTGKTSGKTTARRDGRSGVGYGLTRKEAARGLVPASR
jgi:hypothetical protein